MAIVTHCTSWYTLFNIHRAVHKVGINARSDKVFLTVFGELQVCSFTGYVFVGNIYIRS